MLAERRLLLVHAHPDDETINNAGTMAKYVTEGASVTLVTCTAGEEGEVLVADLAHVASDRENRLGEIRREELASAMKELGVTDHRFLGGFGRFRDSGMDGTDANNHPDCFKNTDLLAAASELVSVIREVKPQVLVTYDDFGGYGHPDHIQAHRVAMYAASLAGAASFRPDLGESHEIAKIYWSAMPRGEMAQVMNWLREQGVENEFTNSDPAAMPFLCDDALVTTVIRASEHHPKKLAALAAHRTQIDLTSGFFAMLAGLDAHAFGMEHYRLVKGTAVGDPLENDLFAGL